MQLKMHHLQTRNLAIQQIIKSDCITAFNFRKHGISSGCREELNLYSCWFSTVLKFHCFWFANNHPFLQITLYQDKVTNYLSGLTSFILEFLQISNSVPYRQHFLVLQWIRWYDESLINRKKQLIIPRSRLQPFKFIIHLVSFQGSGIITWCKDLYR